MNKICGYSCEHNKSGVCQISVCDKKSIISDNTEVQIFTRYIDPIITKLQQENKILRENAENNDKTVDKVNWENQLLKKENEKLKDNWNELKEFMSYENISRLFDMGYDANDFINEIEGKIKELEETGIGGK